MSLMKGVNYFTANPEKPEEMSITEFYNNQEIFITGGSGFIGKALIEKLLRSFSNFKKMFILMRPKKDKSADKRLQELLDNVIFQRAREEQPEAFNKIYAIAGDCKELGIGIKNIFFTSHRIFKLYITFYFKYGWQETFRVLGPRRKKKCTIIKTTLD
uniref:Fatty acyl-CoA reductase n=1 Tax=Glossina brevipalpis TaxID=37001 RepID=A0A1A9WDN3_9MUSC